MIISASYKTDIPTFYGRWFINRLRAGYCKAINPYNRKVHRVDLTLNSVDGFIFWTKNIGPFWEYLPEISKRGFPFLVQYTINGYPRSLESSVIDAERSVDYLRRITDTYGPKAAVWRYDTVIFSSLTSVDFHRRNFSRLAKMLEGATDEVVISFAQLFKKTRRNLDVAAKELGFVWEDPAVEVKYELATELAQLAKSYGLQLTMCSQKEFLAPGVLEAHCVDAKRLSEIAGRPIVCEIKGNRVDCACFASKDIGEYDTCPHGCVYCYAVQNHALAKHRFQEHNPNDEFLFMPKGASTEESSGQINLL